ncbi:MAG: hypothetical protein M3015_11955 [Bacteroidota bacterium]|nr:hypothetical protein [Bacteroidota bacterium]
MRQIKFFIAGIVLLFLVFTAFTLFLPSKVTVSKSIEINAPESTIIAQLNSFNNWKNWFPAFQDTNVIVTISSYQNHSAELRDNSGRIMLFKMLSVAKDTVNVGLYIKEKSKTAYQFILTSVNTRSTDITWNIITDLGWYPWKKLQGIVLDKFTGGQYMATLQKLKNVVEGHVDKGTSE